MPGRGYTRSSTSENSPPETLWKIPDEVAVAYAAHRGKQEIPHPSVRRQMELRRPAPYWAEGAGIRPKIHGSQAILDAVFYALKSGCPWRLLPKDFPRWKSVYDWFGLLVGHRVRYSPRDGPLTGPSRCDTPRKGRQGFPRFGPSH